MLSLWFRRLSWPKRAFPFRFLAPPRSPPSLHVTTQQLTSTGQQPVQHRSLTTSDVCCIVASIHHQLAISVKPVL